MIHVTDYFSYGNQYDEDGKEPDNEPRSKCCNSCAFTNCKKTVRPPNFSLKELMAQGDYFDIFYCHEPDKDGNLKICAAWYKEFGEQCLPRYFKSEKEIEEILNKD